MLYTMLYPDCLHLYRGPLLESQDLEISGDGGPRKYWGPLLEPSDLEISEIGPPFWGSKSVLLPVDCCILSIFAILLAISSIRHV